MKNFLLTILLLIIGAPLLAETSIIQTLPSGIDGMKETSQQKESVVCVHAFLRSYRSLKPIGHVLEKDNYDVFIWNYETRKFTLERHAEHLNKLLKRIAELKPGVPINFVTHSVGGVIVRVALARSDCPEEAKKGRAILMAPPNAGSTLARRYRSLAVVQFIFGGKLGRQLLTYSPNRMLNIAKIPPTVDVLILSGNKRSRFIPFRLNGENDGKVCTVETQLDTPHKGYVINTNHTYIITDRKSLFLMREFLKHGKTTPVIEQVPEDLEQKVKENKQKSSRLNPSQNKDIYVIHCFGSHPYNLYGFPKTWKPSQQKISRDLGKSEK
ncbi:alpha/beta hydrolase family protein [Chlamydia ibidis]|uniref:Alpha/beta hydrolase family protein n=2 Tax=Chlamydia ibidis TaxID=1405396 RepID=S7KHR6_9CHLA|nr:alpha/beta hydrolase [Chlamydia ibidis]EPP35696.1 alpha/beta hydrolase family protein [Chlamydia ibidis]EQM62744.1 alpha/beta hydrolase family protein [Chlamydia ibidis 10-1398/6]